MFAQSSEAHKKRCAERGVLELLPELRSCLLRLSGPEARFEKVTSGEEARDRIIPRAEWVLWFDDKDGLASRVPLFEPVKPKAAAPAAAAAAPAAAPAVEVD